jgi:hypothetical protein
MRAGDKDRTQFPPGGEIAHAIGHMAPSRSTNAAAPICLRGSPRSRCSRRPVRQIFAKSRRSTPALALFAPEEPKDLPAAADITPAEIASNPRAPNVVRVLIADLGERPPAPSSSPPTISLERCAPGGCPIAVEVITSNTAGPSTLKSRIDRRPARRGQPKALPAAQGADPWAGHDECGDAEPSECLGALVSRPRRDS